MIMNISFELYKHLRAVCVNEDQLKTSIKFFKLVPEDLLIKFTNVRSGGVGGNILCVSATVYDVLFDALDDFKWAVNIFMTGNWDFSISVHDWEYGMGGRGQLIPDKLPQKLIDKMLRYPMQ